MGSPVVGHGHMGLVSSALAVQVSSLLGECSLAPCVPVCRVW